MNFKTLSGIIVTRDHDEGRIRINLDDNTLEDAPDGVSIGKTHRVGSGRYSRTPCAMVALREIKIHHHQYPGPHIRDIIENDYLVIDDVSISASSMEIKWESKGSSKIEEISYMVMGEVP